MIPNIFDIGYCNRLPIGYNRSMLSNSPLSQGNEQMIKRGNLVCVDFGFEQVEGLALNDVESPYDESFLIWETETNSRLLVNGWLAHDIDVEVALPPQEWDDIVNRYAACN